ncbi:peptidoglycan-binding domain-containing protein [Streptomyces sp. NPDC054849]
MGFNPLRIRPYVTLPDPGEPDAPAPPPPISGVVTPAPHPVAAQDDTPAYGIAVPPADGPWREGPEHAPRPAETVRLQPVPEAGYTYSGVSGDDVGGGGGGGGGGPEKRTGAATRKPLTLLLVAASVVALSGTAMAVWVLPTSAGSDTAMVAAKPSAPATSTAPAASSDGPASASPSRSASPSPSASKSASPSPSASKSAPASPSPSPSASRSSSPPPAQAPILRYGDSGPEVEKLQRLLAAQGLYRGKFDGKFGWRVEEALSDFQYDQGIDDQEWGFYGPVTRKALEG